MIHKVIFNQKSQFINIKNKKGDSNDKEQQRDSEKELPTKGRCQIASQVASTDPETSD